MLITSDELARGLALVTFGSAAGGLALAVPGSPLWLLPAALGLGASALTVPEIREEAARALPGLLAAPGQAVALLGQGGRALRSTLPAPRPAAVPPAAMRAAPAPAPAATPRPGRRGARPAPTASEPMRPREWLHALNDEPDRAPHALVTGPTGSGKTTAARAFLGQRPGQSIVLTPKLTPDSWNGAEVITLDDEGGYTPLADALTRLEVEKRQRIKRLRSEGAGALQPLTIVIDEVPEVVRFIPLTGLFITSMAGIGRELQMRLVLLSTSTRVAALGIKGRADTLENFVRLDIDRDRRAELNDGVTVRPVELGNVRGGAERARLRPWRQPEPIYGSPATATTTHPQPPSPATDRDMLAGLLGVPTASGRDGNARAVPVPVPVPTPLGNGNGGDGQTRSLVMVTPGNGAPVVNVAQHMYVPAGTPPGSPEGAAVIGRARRRGRGLDMRRRRALATQERKSRELLAAYRTAGAAGTPFRQVYAALGGHKGSVFPAWQEGRQAGHQEGAPHG